MSPLIEIEGDREQAEKTKQSLENLGYWAVIDEVLRDLYVVQWGKYSELEDDL